MKQINMLIFTFMTLLALVAGLPNVDSAEERIPHPLVPGATLSVFEFEAMYNITLDPIPQGLQSRQRGSWHNWDNVNHQPSYGGPPYCRDNDAWNWNECILVSRMPWDDPMYFELYLYDHNCVEIGRNQHVDYWTPFGFDSQLPWVIVLPRPAGGRMGFAYADRWISSNDYIKYECYNTGDGDSLQPACQIHWRC